MSLARRILKQYRASCRDATSLTVTGLELTSAILGYFDTEEEAQRAGIDWSRAWVDSYG
ncbi:hypothetical protein P0D84_04860 [Paraburkholderia sp. RL17-337-BIB-A]